MEGDRHRDARDPRDHRAVVSVCSQDPRLEIGHGVAVQVRRIDGEIAGVAYWHPCHGYNVEGWVPVATPGGWDLVSEEPLTLSPSLLCRACGHHGFVRDGRWVPA